MFYVGQKVVCVRPALPHEAAVAVCARVGEIYTVAKIWVYGGRDVIGLVELPSPQVGFFLEGFLADAFRPAVERKTDISIFTAMLNPSKKRVTA